MATSARGKTHHDVATAMSNLGIAHRRDGNGAKAKELQSSALTLLKAEPDKNVVAISVVRSHLATTLKGLGERDAAQAELEKALAIQQRLLGPNNQNTTQTLDSLGALAYAAGDYSTAKKHWVLALQGRQLTLGPAHRLVADSLANLGLVQSAMGAIDGAINSYKRVVEIRSEVLDATHPDLGETYNNLGTLYRGAGDNEKAAGAFQQAHDIYRAAVGEEHPLVAVTLVNLGDLDAERGDTNEAISKYLGAAQLFAGKREHVGHLAYCLTSLAYAHVDTEGWGEAVLAAEQAVSIRERILAPARSVADSRFALAQGLRGLGRARRAREEGIRARNGFDTAGDSEATKTVTAWLKKK